MGAGKPVKTMVHKVHWSALRTLQQLHQGVAGYFMYFEGFTEMLGICQIPCKFLSSRLSTVSTLGHAIFFSMLSFLFEAEFWAVAVIESNYYLKINVEQEMRPVYVLFFKCLLSCWSIILLYDVLMYCFIGAFFFFFLLKIL